MNYKSKHLIWYIIAFLAVATIGLISCKKDEKDTTPLLAALYSLTTRATTTSSSSSTSVSGSTTLSANTPVGRQVTVAAGSTVTQKVNISSASSLQDSRSAQTRATAATLTLSLYKSDGTFIDGCADAVSAPGATSVTLTCAIAAAGTYVIQLKSTATATVSFDAPVGATVVVTTSGSSGFELLSIVFASDATASVTKNIGLTAVISHNQIIIFLRKIDATTKVGTDITDASVKVTFKTNAETALPYTTNIFGQSTFNGYYNSTSTAIPNFNSTQGGSASNINATGGDTVRLVITAADGSFKIDKTLTYPNSISDVKINGTQVKYAIPTVTHTVSRAAGTTVTWTNPATNAPQFVSVNAGNNTNRVDTLPWNALVSVVGSLGTYSIPSSVLTANATVTTTTDTDNCIGVFAILTGNYTMFPSYYNGDVVLNGVTSPTSSLIVVSNNSSFSNFYPHACETKLPSSSSSLWGANSYNPLLVVTE